MARRLVRKPPLSERVKGYLDLVDISLRFQEWLHASEWEEWLQESMVFVGIALNVVFAIARANSGHVLSNTDDGVFGDETSSTGSIRWGSWLASVVVYFLTALSLTNAFNTFLRRKHYRLFESPVDKTPATSSAQRVRVDSSPIASSPLRFLSKVWAAENAESRRHPEPSTDVWELTVWDPTPISLRLFCFLSPGHVLIYWLLLPTSVTDPQPSVKVVIAITMAVVLSFQLSLLRSTFSQFAKDSAVIQKEVMNEYDTKFVHPRTQHLMRDVGTQFSTPSRSQGGSLKGNTVHEDVDLRTPTYVINKGFHTRPNPAYHRHTDPYDSTETSSKSRALKTPSQIPGPFSPFQNNVVMRQPQFRSQGTGDGGSLGMYSHSSSPIRRSDRVTSPNPQDRSQTSQKHRGSPLKRNVSSSKI